DVEVARRVAQHAVSLSDGFAVVGEHRTRERVRGRGVHQLEYVLVVAVLVHVHRHDRPEVLGGEHRVPGIVRYQHGGLDEVTDTVVATSAGEHLQMRIGGHACQQFAVLRERLRIDHRTAEV